MDLKNGQTKNQFHIQKINVWENIFHYLQRAQIYISSALVCIVK